MSLITTHDAALFDLDGVIYLGPNAIDGVPEVLHTLRQGGTKVGFVTNNAARTPQVVAEHLQHLGIEANDADIVNSTMATLRMLGEELPAGATVLPVGSSALEAQLRQAGYTVVTQRSDRPDAVVQGYDPDLDWRRLEMGAFAIQDGARWFVTNPDMTRPTHEGIVPGCGAQVQAIQACVDVQPDIAGKPYPPLLVETVERLGAKRPIFVGDRIDTDILGANNVGMVSLFVFTGAHGKHDLIAAQAGERPTHIGYDISALLEEPRSVERRENEWVCRQQRVAVEGGHAKLLTTPLDIEAQLDALWVLLQLAWSDDADVFDAANTLQGVR
ncbi:HAD-IIA family hydrolase [uncultured Tessaracoccus sp.]|uniref:HAD-IIA family hydrolase n=1 Tax=uncultured Tessaracoccus sp. TaxID=905023 RepID=UPI00260E9888|nr:HAD-IIA family hydrolase [uncultured Tessaracoccus sp.]